MILFNGVKFNIMNGNKGEEKNNHNICCGHHDSKQIFLFGVALLFIGLMMQGNVSVPGILIILGMAFTLKGILIMVLSAKK